MNEQGQNRSLPVMSPVITDDALKLLRRDFGGLPLVLLP